jgi:hypothetical protein
MDLDHPGWLRLYPINFRELEQVIRFRKYDVVTVNAVPARNDARLESWRPKMDTLQVVKHLQPWNPRRPWLDPVIEDSMCEINKRSRADVKAPSLGLVRAADIGSFDLEPHPGWTPDERAKIDGYVNQLTLFGNDDDRTALEAPRFRGYYRWRCYSKDCNGHRQGIIDWEFVALQRRLADREDIATTTELTKRFLDEICDAAKDVAFYVGNQAKRPQTFSILGVYYPPRT